MLYGAGIRFGSRSGPLFPDRFLLVFFNPSGRLRACYFTLENARVCQAISNSLFISSHIFRLYKGWGAVRAIYLAKKQTFYAEFILTRDVRLGVHKFSEKSRSHLLILGMKKVPFLGAIDIKCQRKKFIRRGDLAPWICAPLSKIVNTRAVDCRVEVQLLVELFVCLFVCLLYP